QDYFSDKDHNPSEYICADQLTDCTDNKSMMGFQYPLQVGRGQTPPVFLCTDNIRRAGNVVPPDRSCHVEDTLIHEVAHALDFPLDRFNHFPTNKNDGTYQVGWAAHGICRNQLGLN
ncbi:MAG: hypothetical protein R3194_03250, partial [Limnobacter sp.]|nr:hypothetical protein [Limnobacter sp.]